MTADDGDIEMCPFNATVLFVSPSRIKSLPEELYYQVATELIYRIRLVKYVHCKSVASKMNRNLLKINFFKSNTEIE